MASSDLWYRKFNRSKEDDEDLLATTEIREAYFKDFFGQWLQKGQNANVHTFDELLMEFWNGSRANPQTNSFSIFCVADGGFIKWNPENDKWLKQSVRFIAFASSDDNPFSDLDGNSWTLCIVGSSALKSPQAFLQVACWDTKTFRFYERSWVQIPQEQKPDGTYSRTGWIYQGASIDAFTKEDSYLGPFNGHVNGALVMKELHKPWLHWSSDNNSFVDRLSDKNKADFMAAPYLTDQSARTLFSGVSSAEGMEPIVENGVNKWYNQRRRIDFLDEASKPLEKPSHVKRWMAHLLLTTTTNIIPSQSLSKQCYAPADHFYDAEMLSQYTKTGLMENVDVPEFLFDPIHYYRASEKLGLALLLDVEKVPDEGYLCLPKGTLGGGKLTDSYDQTKFIQVRAGEGDGGMFTILQSSYEDAQGVLKMQTIKDNKKAGSTLAILSAKVFNALMMVDFCNPIYSWRRGVLMQYVPDEICYDSASNKYDLEDQLIANVKNSSHYKNADTSSPEHQFISLLETSLEDMQARIKSYFTKVVARLQTEDGMFDYLTLAESRRRIYRPVPLNEFGFTLPYALNYPTRNRGRFEMTENGDIQDMNSRGMRFFYSLTGTQNDGSLAGFDPSIIPKPDDDGAQVFVTPETIKMTASSQAQISPPAPQDRRGCPFRRTIPVQISKGPLPAPSEAQPTWDDNIKSLFTAPYWLAEGVREKVGAHWVEKMIQYGWNLNLEKMEDVVAQAVTVYQHLRSRSMPITTNQAHFWPDEALEMFRTWVNQGCRKSSKDSIKERVIISPPNDPPVKMRVRKDIKNLTMEELQSYRAKLQDILEVGALKSKWQDLGELHAFWCLHYQEATFLWHRAYLRYVEELIDFPIPYWNGFAKDTGDPNSSCAGLPSIFTEDTYIHPSGKEMKNPLKYALAYHGLSKSGKSQYVQRDRVLIEGKSSPGWPAKIRLFSKYHEQIVHSFQQATYSAPQGIGVAWAALPLFGEDMPDADYQGHRSDFDGLFEQAHDNYHGWIGGKGGDMADNTYTAFDPIFLSYHCNMDRLVEKFLRSKPEMQYSSNFPLRPFTNQALDLDNGPKDYIYTTLGDMAKDTKALQYLYAPPASPDIFTLPKVQRSAKPSGGRPITILDATPLRAVATHTDTKRVAWIVFKDVACTTESYEIDIFLTGAKSQAADPENLDFVGRLFRFGMGRPPAGVKMMNVSRCAKPKVTRTISAEHVSDKISRGFFQVVREMSGGEEVPKEEWSTWEGFQGRLMWTA